MVRNQTLREKKGETEFGEEREKDKSEANRMRKEEGIRNKKRSMVFPNHESLTKTDQAKNDFV
ncbi:hypothetical protein AB3N58_07175 [Leptospira sp. WS60.C2]